MASRPARWSALLSMLKRMTSVLRRDGPLDVAKEHGILDLALEELDRLLALAVVANASRSQQVGQDLEEVRLAGAEESGDPDADLAGDVGVASGS